MSKTVFQDFHDLDFNVCLWLVQAWARIPFVVIYADNFWG